MALSSGDTLLNGQYEILRLLGRGGFGFVYQAQDTQLGEQVAIKELIPALVGDETTLKRFLAEAKATLRLTHERIVRTFHVFPEGGNYYIVMECMSEGSLETRLQSRRPMRVQEAIQVAAQVCEGLSYAHKRGVVHCDLKPANILFAADGSAKVADFGIAHVSEQMLSRTWLTPAGFVAGTLPYMSPEQTDGVRDDPRVDVYALGAVLYRMLTGHTYLDFDPRETPRAQVTNVERICRQPPARPSTHQRRIPSWLDEVVLKALAKQPDDRYANAEELRTALLRQGPKPALEAPPVEIEAKPAPPPRDPARAAARRSRWPLPTLVWPLLGGVAVVLTVIVVAIVVGSAGRGSEKVVASPTAMVAAVAEALSGPTFTSQPATTTPEPTDTQKPPTSTPIPPTTTPTPTRTQRLPTSTPVPRTATPKATSTQKPLTDSSSPLTVIPTPKPGATRTRQSDKMVMVYVPAGEFLMGSAADEGYDNEHPQHTVSLDAFWIDKTEVTNAQYRKCVEAGTCREPTSCDWGEPTYSDPSKAKHPVVCVGWDDATAYCTWVEARLPTEAEWEKAAGGTDGRKYPWGNSEPDCKQANYWGKDGGCVGETSAVGSYPTDISPYGALDMAGNVWEWVSDWFDDGYYARSPASNPPGPASGQERVLRGGSWYFTAVGLRTTARFRYLPDARGDVAGFRCAASPTPSP